MNDPWTTGQQQKNAGEPNENILLVTSGVLWIFVLITFLWFFEYRSGVEKILGWMSLFLGASVIFTPSKLRGNKIWLRSAIAFNITGIGLLVLIKYM